MPPRRLASLFLFACTLQAQDASGELHKLFDSEWERTLNSSPVFASTMGDRRANDRWGDLSISALAHAYELEKQALARLQAISRSELSPADRVNYDLFHRLLSDEIGEHEIGWQYVPVNMREGIQTTSDVATLLRFETVKDYQDWIARMRAFPLLVDQTIALMREGMRRKLVQPKIVMQRIPAQIDRELPADSTTSAFYKPFTKFPANIPPVQRAALSKGAQDALRNSVFPALRKFKLFVESEYIHASYDDSGIWQAPEGEKIYAFFAREHTTTYLTPDQIHEIGLREVARIKDEMYAILKRTGFKGTLPEFFQYLRTDPSFFYSRPQELLDGYRILAKRIDPLLVKLFRILPRTPYGVEPIPDAIAPDTTTAYYMPPAGDGTRAGTFYVNLYKPEVRPKWEMTALTLHESVPGHHLQIALNQELTDVPKFRRYLLGFTAYVEGWGLYAESLGQELGLYDDPYAKFGQLTYEMWRAVRLVVDTGIHAKRWSRQKAIDYFLQNAPKTELDVTNEVDRYIGWPGQALAYKIGELKIQELRKKAVTELGPKFDIRDFHRVVLGSGAIPLDVLESNVNEWIAARR